MIGSSRVYFLKGGKCSRTVLLKRESFTRRAVFSNRRTCASWKAVVYKDSSVRWFFAHSIISCICRTKECDNFLCLSKLEHISATVRTKQKKFRS